MAALCKAAEEGAVTYMLVLIGALMLLTVHRFVVAIRCTPRDNAGIDHCEKCFAVLVVALAVTVK